MALAVSPPLTMGTVMDNTLDDEIAELRAEIQTLTARRKLLTSSLLSSTKVQSQLFTATTPPLNLTNIQAHSQSNTHRLAFGVTAFPFTDPSPELQSKNPLLGIRFDICNRRGKFDSPYYLFCIRAGEPTGGHELRIHRHTIPALVPLEQYEREFLPLHSSLREHEDDEGYAGSDDSRQGTGNEQRKQDIHGLVARVRHDLVSWRSRQDSAEWLKEELGLSQSSDTSKNTGRAAEDDGDPDTSMQDSEERDSGSEKDDNDEPMGKFNVSSLNPLDTSARQLRLIWADDRVGRLKVSDTGKIEKAVVIGEDGSRVRDVERILMGDQEAAGVNVTQLLARLEIVYTKSMAVEEEPEAPPKSQDQPKTKGKSRKKRKS